MNPSNPESQVPPLHAQPPQKKGLGTGAKIGIGCGAGCLTLVVVAIIVGVIGTNWVMGKIEQFETELVDAGMVLGEEGQMLTVTQVPTQPTYYKGQIVTLNFAEPVTVEVGVLAQQVEIVQGEFAETVYGRGQIIIVNPGVKLAKDLNVKCQIVQDLGATIEGSITGEYQVMQ